MNSNEDWDKSLIAKLKMESSGSVDKRKRENEHRAETSSSPEIMKAKISSKEKKLKNSSDLSYLPDKWSLKENLSGNVLYINSEGEEFKSRIEALQFMIKNKYDPKTILNFWNSLEEEGWVVMEDQIPSGWRAQYNEDILDYRYLTQDMTLLRSTEEASTNIKDKGDFVQIIKFESWAA